MGINYHAHQTPQFRVLSDRQIEKVYTDKHTLKHFRELWQPALFSRQRADKWIATGSKRLGQRLKEKTVSIIEEHQPEPLPDNVREEIDYILNASQTSTSPQ